MIISHLADNYVFFLFKAKSSNNLRYILVSTLGMDKNIKCTLYYVLIKLSFGFCYQSSNIYNGKLNNK